MKGSMEADDRGSGDQRDDNLQSRRELLKSAGGYATYVAPAMVVLLKGDPAFLVICQMVTLYPLF